jgi:hypothetical protein
VFDSCGNIIHKCGKLWGAFGIASLSQVLAQLGKVAPASNGYSLLLLNFWLVISLLRRVNHLVVVSVSLPRWFRCWFE